jgi:hypothetical protein
MTLKTCSKCKAAKPLYLFPKKRPNGRVPSHCLKCLRDNTQKREFAKWLQ